ncbi:hypothetical protein O3Q52_21590 [Streptomyces sp. ActVer]|uniref:hypothetical protein n=1 Tax=Streptomyces sp. ActVer TaxID=3014558 RepID=UPI0022B4FD5E|nr:hypothetical protein [Streptomyces sp. ActVer]MCZ4510735.1 hypothetical protein [Streptomyces sp. ActVer]
MINVKSLVKRVNPMPDETTATAVDGMSARAYDELVGLVGAEAAERQAGQGRGVWSRRSSRRGVLVAAVACTAAAVVAGVAVLALQDPKKPGGGGGDGGGSGLADEPYFAKTAELEAASVLIVRARLGAGHEETVDGLTETVATAEVVATAKGGSPAGSEIELAYTTPGSGPETAELAAGKEYVLLLDELDGGRFTLINTTQGVYGIEGGHAVAGGDNDVTLSPGVLKALRLTS